MPKARKRNTDNVVTMTPAEPASGMNTPSESIEEAVARRAFEFYCARGYQDGYDVEDWLQAERELRAERSSPAA